MNLTKTKADKIIKTICNEYCITKNQLRSKKRTEELAEPRAVISYILYQLNHYSPKKIGELLNRTRANGVTVSKRVLNEMEVNKVYRSKIEKLVELTCQ